LRPDDKEQVENLLASARLARNDLLQLGAALTVTGLALVAVIATVAVASLILS
jgi:hypothetical protein